MTVSRKMFVRPVRGITEAVGFHTGHRQAGELERPIATQPKELGAPDAAPRHKLVFGALEGLGFHKQQNPEVWCPGISAKKNAPCQEAEGGRGKAC